MVKYDGITTRKTVDLFPSLFQWITAVILPNVTPDFHQYTTGNSRDFLWMAWVYNVCPIFVRLGILSRSTVDPYHVKSGYILF